MSLSANEYQQLARRTALQDHPIPERFHWCLGVAGEWGEIAAVYRGAVQASINTSLDKASAVELGNEIGDMLWYLANLAHAYAIPFEDCQPLSEPSETSLDLDGYWLKQLGNHISALMERVKKVEFYLNTDYPPIVGSDLRLIVVCLQAMLYYADPCRTLEACMAQNIAKLEARYPDKFNR